MRLSQDRIFWAIKRGNEAREVTLSFWSPDDLPVLFKTSKFPTCMRTPWRRFSTSTIKHFDFFLYRVAIFYNEAIPRIEKKIGSFAANDDLITVYVDLKQKLNICKIELLRIFRYITTSVIFKALDNRLVFLEWVWREANGFVSILCTYLFFKNHYYFNQGSYVQRGTERGSWWVSQ